MSHLMHTFASQNLYAYKASASKCLKLCIKHDVFLFYIKYTTYIRALTIPAQLRHTLKTGAQPLEVTIRLCLFIYLAAPSDKIATTILSWSFQPIQVAKIRDC